MCDLREVWKEQGIEEGEAKGEALGRKEIIFKFITQQQRLGTSISKTQELLCHMLGLDEAVAKTYIDAYLVDLNFKG